MIGDRWKCVVCGQADLRSASEAKSLAERVFWTPSNWQGQVKQQPICGTCRHKNLEAIEVVIDITEAFDE